MSNIVMKPEAHGTIRLLIVLGIGTVLIAFVLHWYDNFTKVNHGECPTQLREQSMQCETKLKECEADAEMALAKCEANTEVKLAKRRADAERTLNEWVLRVNACRDKLEVLTSSRSVMVDIEIERCKLQRDNDAREYQKLKHDICLMIHDDNPLVCKKFLD